MDRKTQWLPVAAVLLAAMALTGCQTTEKVIYKDKPVFVRPHPDAVKDCNITPPPIIAEYLAGDFDKREDMLTRYSAALTVEMQKCNTQLGLLRIWLDEQAKIYSNDPKP